MKAVNYKEAADILSGMERVIVVSHVGPDIDAYGSMCAVGLALEKLGKKVLFLNESPLVPHLCFIEGAKRIVQTIPADWSDAPAVICDCGDAKRVGDSLKPELFNEDRKTLNIDHHISNDGYATYNIVDAEASSTCEIVFEILRVMDLELDADIALCLFAGISGDTGSFQYPSTSARTFEVAHELVNLGAKPYDVYLNLYGNTPLSVFQLQAHALSALKLHFDNQLAEVFIDRQTFEQFGVADAQLDKIQETALKIDGVKISCFIREDGDLWKVSLRAKGQKLDVSQIAQSFGGGGHKAAAAFRRRGDVESFRADLLSKCEQLLGEG